MALRNASASRNGRRVMLTRPGNKGAPGRNSRREVKARRSVRLPLHLPLQRLKNIFSTGIVLSIVLFFITGVGFSLMYAYRSLTSGEYFALKTLEIQGNSRLSSREILETADLAEGGNTLNLSIDAVEGALAKHPWVAEVSVKRVLPGTLIIGIREKNPAFWVLHDDTLHYADAYGKIIAPVIPGKIASLPALEVEPGAEEATAALPDLVESLRESHLPLNMGAISSVHLSAARGVEVYIEDTNLKISIGLEEWLPNLRRLGLTLGDLIRRGELADVREIRAQGANVWVERRTHFGTRG